MERANLNPLYIILLYFLRCVVPLGLMLGVSYLLRRFGFIKETPPPPEEWDEEGDTDGAHDGGPSHD
jgi:hypothetical protein